MFKTKYRIVRDRFAGYEAQVKYWWWPFYMQIGGTNTSGTIERSKRIIEAHKQPVVWVDS